MVAFQLTALVCFVTAFEVGHVDAFRWDYTFLESTDSYYKLYREGFDWADAKAKCESAGATMFHPNNEAELLDVFRVLDVKQEMVWIRTGMTLDTPDVFKTVDGRLDSHVYNKWRSGEPSTCQDCHCVILSTIDHTMVKNPCSVTWPLICKHSTEIKTTLASPNISDLEGRLANQSAVIAALEQMTMNQTAELKVLRQLKTNQSTELNFLKGPLDLQDAIYPAVLERLMAIIANQTAVVQLQTEAIIELVAHQNAKLKQTAEANANQCAPKRLQTEAIKVYIENQPLVYLMEAVRNQAASIDRQAGALEKLVNGNNDQLGI